MVARRRGPERLSAAFSVRLPPALLAVVDAFVVRANEGDPLGVDPIGRTDVIRRALGEYLAARGAISAAQAPAQRAEGAEVKPSKAKAPKSPPRGAQAPEDDFTRSLAALDLPELAPIDLGELAPIDFDKGGK
jgi:hypothetical protein